MTLMIRGVSIAMTVSQGHATWPAAANEGVRSAAEWKALRAILCGVLCGRSVGDRLPFARFHALQIDLKR
jgi:hypothetical protein